MWFGFGDQLLRFGINEFEAITGLSCNPYKAEFKFKKYECGRLIGKPRCSIHELEGLFATEPKSSKYKLNMAYMLVIDCVLLSREKKVRISDECIGLVGDLENLPNIPIGRYAFMETLKQLSKVFHTDGSVKSGYHLNMFPLAFLVSAYVIY